MLAIQPVVQSSFSGSADPVEVDSRDVQHASIVPETSPSGRLQATTRHHGLGKAARNGYSIANQGYPLGVLIFVVT